MLAIAIASCSCFGKTLLAVAAQQAVTGCCCCFESTNLACQLSLLNGVHNKLCILVPSPSFAGCGVKLTLRPAFFAVVIIQGSAMDILTGDFLLAPHQPPC
jgi:hypothetical protein